MQHNANYVSRSSERLIITVVYDKKRCIETMRTGWGFSLLVTGTSRTILFDTGPEPDALLSNLSNLGVEPAMVEVVVLSHIHRDHSGGLYGFLEKNPRVSVYLPDSFPQKFITGVEKYGAEIVKVKGPSRICKGLYCSGEVGTLIKEQALVVETAGAAIIVTGCCHPGMVKMLEVCRSMLKKDIYAVLGGFHLEWASRGKIEKVASAFREYGVRLVGPGHCTGEKASRIFTEHFGDSCLNLEAGKRIEF